MRDEPCAEAIDHIRRNDLDFERALGLISPLPSRYKPAGFKHLCQIIIEQQVSLASAASIWKRLTDAVSPFTPITLLGYQEDELKSFGLSHPKARYCLSLANEILEGRLDLDALSDFSDQDAIDALISVKGIGRWTAEIYLISCLNRQDIWPAGDVALQTAMQHLKNLDTRPDVSLMDAYSEPLRPYRTLGARILWRYYSDVVKPSTRLGK
ncbi:DNA-3-methyladenine glycosylase family protein [Sneathiella glossodoripedis]|uniref:DNA-3-methyladenine glycosylase family protein n=1 Tax=Sneathiella glossodoripedis TaxID=418853 RepID=UPI00046FF3D0|nr:DNA-3-methyladenine glycosylase 2 family protein [Sneathiella glossodoripedis]